MAFDIEYQKSKGSEWKRHRSYTDYVTADSKYQRYKEVNPGYGWRVVEHIVTVHAAYSPIVKRSQS